MSSSEVRARRVSPSSPPHRTGSFRRAILGTLLAAGVLALPVAPVGASLGQDATPRPDYRPALTPSRLLDTRLGVGAPAGAITAGAPLSLTVVRPGAVEAGATAVALNVTVTGPEADGFLTVWPCGVDRPTTSNLNFRAGQTVPNLVISRIGTGGAVCIASSATTHVIADLSGWYGNEAAFVPLVPLRVLETRAPAGQVNYTGAKPAAGRVIELPVAGVGAANIPTTAEAVVLNITGVEATDAGYVTVWPCGQPMPTASNLNLQRGETRPNLVITQLGDGGKVCIFTERGAHVLADLFGWFARGAGLTSLLPSRILETRAAAGQAGYSGAKPTAGQLIRLKVTGVAPSNVPADIPAVLLNITGVDATAAGYVTVWPCGQPMPTVSNLNLDDAGTAANLVIARVGVGGEVCLFTETGTHLVADIAGWFPY